jgi:hypothetical protein
LAKNLKAGDHAITTQKRSKGRAPCSRHRRCSRAKEWLGISPGTAVFVNQSISLGLIDVLDPCLRRWPIGHSPARGIQRAAIQVPRERALSSNGHGTSISNASLCGALATVGRGRSGKQLESPIAISDSAAIYLLGALGRRGCRKRTPGPPPFSSMNSTPAASKARRTAKSLATVREVLSSASSARLIVLSPSDDARARSFALHLRRARAARI